MLFLCQFCNNLISGVPFKNMNSTENAVPTLILRPQAKVSKLRLTLNIIYNNFYVLGWRTSQNLLNLKACLNRKLNFIKNEFRWIKIFVGRVRGHIPPKLIPLRNSPEFIIADEQKLEVLASKVSKAGCWFRVSQVWMWTRVRCRVIVRIGRNLQRRNIQ